VKPVPVPLPDPRGPVPDGVDRPPQAATN